MKCYRHVVAALGILLGFLTIFATPAGAQLTLQGGGGIGIVVPAGDYGGSTIDFYSGTKYGLSTGFNLHGKARVGALGVRVAGEVDFSSLSNSGNSEPGQGSVKVSHQILSFKVGPEYAFSIPLSPVTPYVGVHAGVNILNGEMTFQGVSKISSATYKLQSGTRIGLGGTLGVTFKLNPAMNLDISANYELINLLGRLWEDVNPVQDQRLDSYIALNDDPDPLYAPGNDKHFVNNSRSIHLMQFKATLMFGL